ncbi:hypothetical protein HMPREF3145_09865 [Corynebacterium sp. HMSC05C01]|uniref:DUF4192 domain-containing protein n=1 Tax=Corynebacterium sp. HMSC05C01 TaxID=1581113 RepID=UPI0008A1B2DA|nr:DUF4192 domain-containing protein [Corynebacterium sp. HMSC05C01]OFT68085.1 hypothetical protein HMPREF3145_09865 [Corynebacterium sp. HMSC05C01]
MEQQPISTPGDVIALIPGLLGFYPQESLVVLCFNRDGGYVETSPAMRLDLDQVTEDAFGERFRRITGDYNVVLGVIITRHRHHPVVLNALDHLYVAYVDELIDAIWSVPDVAEGERYHLEYGQQPSMVDDPRFYEGDVASIMASPAMAQLAQHGVLPELSRDDMMGYFALATHRESRYDQVAADAKLHGSEVLDAWADGVHDPARALVAQAMLTIETAQPAMIVPAQIPDPLVLLDTDELTTFVACLTSSKLRDALITVVLDNPQRASQILLAVATCFDGVVRANALCLWSMLATNEDLAGLARAALDAAVDTEPEHRLTRLLDKIMAHGLSRQLLNSAADGANMTLQELGL